MATVAKVEATEEQARRLPDLLWGWIGDEDGRAAHKVFAGRYRKPKEGVLDAGEELGPWTTEWELRSSTDENLQVRQ